MADTADNLTLEHLRSLRAENVELKSELRCVKARLASIESERRADRTRRSGKIEQPVERFDPLEWFA